MITFTIFATLVTLAVLFIVALASTVLVGRLLQAIRVRMAAPLVAEARERGVEREQLIRACGESMVQAVVAVQRDAIVAVAHEGFSAMAQINRDRLSEFHAMRSALLQPRNMVIVESVVPEKVHRLESTERLQKTLPSRKPLSKRIRFWKK